MPPFVNSRRPHRFQSAFQLLVDWPLWLSAAVCVLGLLSVTGAFAVGYSQCLPANSFVSDVDDSAASPAFPDLALYALSLTTTLGQSRVKPVATGALLLANLHALAVQLVLVFVTGVVFTRLSKPGMAVTLCSRLLLGYDDPNLGPVLITRMFFNTPTDRLIDVRFQMTYTRLLSGDFLKTTTLALTRPEAPMLMCGLQITHEIDEESPLCDVTLEELRERMAFFTLTVMGTEQATMQPLFYSQRYSARDGTVVDGAQFQLRDLLELRQGRRVLNFDHMDALIPADATNTGAGVFHDLYHVSSDGKRKDSLKAD